MSHLHPQASSKPAIGIIGGSGLYDIEGVENRREIEVETPFGPPSDNLLGGTLGGRPVFFLPRHGRGHRILPHELNHQANIHALRSLNARWIIAVTAVGSLREQYAPRDILVPDQLFDRTSRREHHTFFGRGIAAHIAFAEPYSAGLRRILLEAARAHHQHAVHDGGTYVNMDGPAFSTRAESEANRQLGFDIIGMTNLPEAKLAREAGIALATLAMITDYDCWKVEEEPVNAQTVVGHLMANADAARKIVAQAVTAVPAEPDWPEHQALAGAVLTPREHWPAETAGRLRLLLADQP